MFLIYLVVPREYLHDEKRVKARFQGLHGPRCHPLPLEAEGDLYLLHFTLGVSPARVHSQNCRQVRSLQGSFPSFPSERGERSKTKSCALVQYGALALAHSARFLWRGRII